MPSFDSLIRLHAEDVAFVAEEPPATTPGEFIDQLKTAADRLTNFAQINGAEELEIAVLHLTEAQQATSDTARDVFLDRAGRLLADTTEIVDEYRLMV